MEQFPLVSADWLLGHLQTPGVRVVDARWRLGDKPGDARARHLAQRIPGSVFFDIDEIADRSTDLPHMAAPADVFAARVRKLGLGDGMSLVIYDDQGIFSAARVWWNFRLMGARDVRVLDGGLPAWLAAGGPVEDGPPPPILERHFTARPHAQLVRSLEEMRKDVAGHRQVMDARPAERFLGKAGEPRAGVRPGHMPGARNLPWSSLLDQDGRMLPQSALQARFAEAGIDLSAPVTVSCGSGVSACVVALAGAVLGHDQFSIYDGSWAQWGQLADAPIISAADESRAEG